MQLFHFGVGCQRLELFPAVGGGDILPAGDDLVQHRAGILQYFTLAFALPQFKLYSAKAFNLTLIGGITGFQVTNHLRVLQRLEVFEDGGLGTLRTTNFVFNPAQFAVTIFTGAG
jgi:hypothetical protein